MAILCIPRTRTENAMHYLKTMKYNSPFFFNRKEPFLKGGVFILYQMTDPFDFRVKQFRSLFFRHLFSLAANPTEDQTYTKHHRDHQSRSHHRFINRWQWNQRVAADRGGHEHREREKDFSKTPSLNSQLLLESLQSTGNLVHRFFCNIKTKNKFNKKKAC